MQEAAQLIAGTPPPLPDDPDSFLVTLPANLAPDVWPALAAQACGARPRCRLSAWNSAALTPAALPLAPDQVATMSFSYIRDRTTGFERTLWNCRTVRRLNPRECMRQQVLLTAFPAVPSTSPSPATPVQPPAILHVPLVLDGVRRTGSPAPTARTPPPPMRGTAAVPVPAAAGKADTPAAP